MPENKSIAIRIADSILDDLSFDNALTNDEQRLFETISCFPAQVKTIESSGTLNNGKNYSHLLYSHKEYIVTISSNELDTDATGFLISFWLSNYKYISIYENSQWSDYILVKSDGGLFPIEYIENYRNLPEITFKFETVNPLEL